jgi:hypothetical protein
MKWSDIQFSPSSRTLRQFAAAWLVFFLALGAQQYWLRGHPQAGVALGALAVGVGGLGLIAPATVRWLFVAAMVVAFPVGWLVSLLMLLVFYYGVLTPVALIFRLRGRDLLHRKPDPQRASFWLPKQTPVDSRRYFRQY